MSRLRLEMERDDADKIYLLTGPGGQRGRRGQGRQKDRGVRGDKGVRGGGTGAAK